MGMKKLLRSQVFVPKWDYLNQYQEWEGACFLLGDRMLGGMKNDQYK
jgi:hypothetical protein